MESFLIAIGCVIYSLHSHGHCGHRRTAPKSGDPETPVPLMLKHLTDDIVRRPQVAQICLVHLPMAHQVHDSNT